MELELQGVLYNNAQVFVLRDQRDLVKVPDNWPKCSIVYSNLHHRTLGFIDLNVIVPRP